MAEANCRAIVQACWPTIIAGDIGQHVGTVCAWLKSNLSSIKRVLICPVIVILFIIFSKFSFRLLTVNKLLRGACVIFKTQKCWFSIISRFRIFRLVYLTPTGGEKILHQEDSTCEIEGEWKRINTLEHFLVCGKIFIYIFALTVCALISIDNINLLDNDRPWLYHIFHVDSRWLSVEAGAVFNIFGWHRYTWWVLAVLAIGRQKWKRLHSRQRIWALVIFPRPDLPRSGDSRKLRNFVLFCRSYMSYYSSQTS